MIKYLYHLLPRHHLLNKTIQCTYILLLGRIILPTVGNQISRYDQHDAHHKKCHHSKRNTKHDHTHRHTHQGDDTVDHLGNTLGYHLPQGIDIIGIDRHDIPMGMGIKIFNRQIFHVVKDIPS